MQRLIAIFVIAIALIPNTGGNIAMGAELRGENNKLKSDEYAQNFDGTYSDEPQKVIERKLSKKTEKIMTYMARAGLDSAGVKQVTYFLNDHMDDNKFRIAGGEYKGFNMKFTHQMAAPSANKLQIRLTNEDMPHWEMTGSNRGAMVNYKLEW